MPRRRIAIWTLRLLLSAVFVYAAYSKLKEPYELFAMSIDSYRLLPEFGVIAVAKFLPYFELAIGVALLIGWKLRYVSLTAMLLLLLFFSILVVSYGKGMTVDCGCFGVGETLSAKTLVRDALLLASAVTLWRLS